MIDRPTTADYSYALHRAGWTIEDIHAVYPDGAWWLVIGRNGENLIRAEHPDQREAWRIAAEQAKACGMFGMYDAAHPLFDLEP